MTRKEVRAILGEPARIEAFAITTERATTNSPLGPMERWSFEYAPPADPVDRPPAETRSGSAALPRRLVLGVVEFAPPDGTVSSWTEPDWSLVEDL